MLGNILLNSSIILLQLSQGGSSVKRVIFPLIWGSVICESISSNILASVSLNLGNLSSTYVVNILSSLLIEKSATSAPLLVLEWILLWATNSDFSYYTTLHKEKPLETSVLRTLSSICKIQSFSSCTCTNFSLNSSTERELISPYHEPVSNIFLTIKTLPKIIGFLWISFLNLQKWHPAKLRYNCHTDAWLEFCQKRF